MSDATERLNAALEGRYAIERELGEGGMATVYLADDLKHERNVALKVLKPELAAVVGAERFLAEIKTTANLTHPHILPLFDSGEADSFLFYVMPYVEGETLRDRIDREKQLPVDEAVALASKVAGALQHAHEHGVIHRDIKPANILLQDGEPVVSDFGIALAVGAAGSNRLTETGLSLGTPYYMSPEQATGDQAVGASTDTYALGSVLYEMLVGDPPFAGSTAQAVLGKIIAGKSVSVREERPSIPANVDAAVRKALEKLPADRFTRAEDFATALSDPAFRYGKPAGAGLEEGQRSLLSQGLALTTVGLAAVAAWSLLSPDAPAPVTRYALSTEVWADTGLPVIRHMAISPDGSKWVFPIGSNGEVGLAVKLRSSTEFTPISGTEGARSASFSPDGEWIVYGIGNELLKRPLVGGSPTTLADDTEEAGPTMALWWLDDGTILYERLSTEAGRAIVRITSDGELLSVVFGEDESHSPIWVHGLPDSRGALVVACPGPITCVSDQAVLYAVGFEDGSKVSLADDVGRAWYVPTGHVVYVRSDGVLFAVPFDLRALEPTGSAVRLFGGVRVSGPNADLAIGGDGTVVYEEGAPSEAVSEILVWIDRDGSEVALDLPVDGLFGMPSISPDGEIIALEYRGHVEPFEGMEVYVYNVSQETFSRISFDDQATRYPFWSPDSGEVGFTSERGGLAALYARPWDLSRDARLLLADPDEPLYEGGWTSDSSTLFYRRGSLTSGSGLRDLGYARVPNGTPTPIVDTPAIEGNPAVSPNSQWMAYTSDDSGVREVYARRLRGPGGQFLVSSGGGDQPGLGP